MIDRPTQTSPNKQVGKQPPATVKNFLVVYNEHLAVKIRQNAMLEFINWQRSKSFERPIWWNKAFALLHVAITKRREGEGESGSTSYKMYRIYCCRNITLIAI